MCHFPTTILLGLVWAGLGLAEDRPGWLNARDCGASGSNFQTTAAATAGSRRIVVANVGDFKPGQGVMVSKCNIHYPRHDQDNTLWGPHDRRAAFRPLRGEVEVRGYDGVTGSWVTYVLDIPPGSPSRFRWTDDLGSRPSRSPTIGSP
jgi:hypothetical protein